MPKIKDNGPELGADAEDTGKTDVMTESAADEALPQDGTGADPSETEGEVSPEDEADATGKSGRGRKPKKVGDGEKVNEAPLPPTPRKDGKKRMRCVSLKGCKVIAGKGETVQVDENGFFEIDETMAARLLTIPGYEEA
jgi:hypothetical protein